MMKIVLSIDDTDVIDSPGSGQLAESLKREIEEKGLGKCDDIVRHQLFVHEDVPFTSHNSAMTFTVETVRENVDEMINLGQDFLCRESAEGSDPGLCVAVSDKLKKSDALVAFGQRAKCEVVTKNAAYGLADELGIHLSEHGGTGDGIIGALAGVGLRIQGCDGRFRGWQSCTKGDSATVGELLKMLGASEARDENGCRVAEGEEVFFSDNRLKTVLQDGHKVIPLTSPFKGSSRNGWMTLTRKEVKRF